VTTVIEKFVAEVVWDIDPEGLKEFNEQANGVLKVGKAIASVVAGAIGAFTGLAAVVNETTSRNAQLAKSVGITAESLEAYEGIFKRIGFEADNVVDLVEEMNNKLGELKGLKEMSSAQDALKLLNIEFKTLRDLEPEQQFEMILDAAKELEDRQIAVSAVDMLMGGEANKIVGYLRTYDDSLEDLIQRQKNLNLLTEEGRKGAERWAFVWGDMRTLVGSLIASFSGLLGEALAPLVEQSIQWVIQNKELIKIKVRDWVEQVRRAIEFLVSVGKGVVGVIDSVGGLNNALKVLGLTIAALKFYKLTTALQVIVTGLNGASVATAAFKAALMGLKTAGIVGLFVLAALALEDLYTTLMGGESVFEPIHNAIGKFLAEDVVAFVAGLLNMDPDKLNLTIVEFFTQTIPDAYNWMVADFEAAIGIFDRFFTETLPDAYNWMVADFETAITPFLDFFLKTFPKAYQSLISNFEKTFSSLQDTVLGVLTSIDKSTNNIFTRVYQTITSWIGRAISWVKTQLKAIPFLGSLTGKSENININQQTISSGDKGQAPATPILSTPTAIVARQKTTNAPQSTVKQNINFAPQMTITQLPGESGEVFANRVTEILSQKVGEAVQNNDKGIVR
jgi:hypothetical protein